MDGTLCERDGLYQQAYMHRRDIGKFAQAVDSYAKKGFELINVEYGAGEWIGVFAKGGKWKDTLFVYSCYRDDFEKSIIKRWRERDTCWSMSRRQRATG